MFYRADRETARMISAREAFPFLKERGHVISFVGAGGKTTLLFELAEYFRSAGYRVLVTTTTHMYRPPEEIRARKEEELLWLWQHGQIAVLGGDAPRGKIGMPDRSLLRAWEARADVVLVEADGARRMPCKAPGSNEPVLLPESDIVIGVMGLEAVGRPLNQVCFRPEETAKLLGVSGEHLLTEEDLAMILLSEHGTRKGTRNRAYYVVLNQCDTKETVQSGLRTARLLAQQDETLPVLLRGRRMYV